LSELFINNDAICGENDDGDMTCGDVYAQKLVFISNGQGTWGDQSWKHFQLPLDPKYYGTVILTSDDFCGLTSSANGGSPCDGVYCPETYSTSDSYWSQFGLSGTTLTNYQTAVMCGAVSTGAGFNCGWCNNGNGLTTSDSSHSSKSATDSNSHSTINCGCSTGYSGSNFPGTSGYASPSAASSGVGWCGVGGVAAC